MCLYSEGKNGSGRNDDNKKVDFRTMLTKYIKYLYINIYTYIFSDFMKIKKNPFLFCRIFFWFRCRDDEEKRENDDDDDDDEFHMKTLRMWKKKKKSKLVLMEQLRSSWKSKKRRNRNDVM